MNLNKRQRQKLLTGIAAEVSKMKVDKKAPKKVAAAPEVNTAELSKTLAAMMKEHKNNG